MVCQVAFNDIINFGMVSCLLAIVTEGRQWFLRSREAARNRRVTGVSGPHLTHPPAPLSPAKRPGKEGEGTVRSQKP